MEASAALSAFQAHVGDACSSLIDREEQASLAVALLEIARERRLLAAGAPLELLNLADSSAARAVCRRGAAIVRRGK